MNSVPRGNLNYEQARRLLMEHLPEGEDWYSHCLAVAKVAEKIALEVCKKVPIDVELVRSSALVHDIGRSKTHDGTLHCWEGYLLLRKLGFPRHARVCMTHSYAGLAPDEAATLGLPAWDFRPRSLEEKIVTLADSCVDDNRVVDYRQRLESVRRRYRAKGAEQMALAMIDLIEIKVKILLEEIEGLIGCSINEILES